MFIITFKNQWIIDNNETLCLCVSLMNFEELRCLALLFHISNSSLYLPHPNGIIKRNNGFAESVNGFFDLDCVAMPPPGDFEFICYQECPFHKVSIGCSWTTHGYTCIHIREFRGGDAHKYRLESRTDSEQKHTAESSAMPSSHWLSPTRFQISILTLIWPYRVDVTVLQ